MVRHKSGRALFYTRDSGGKHETTPTEYVGWAQRRSEELGLVFSGTAAGIKLMIQDKISASGDLFLDYGVQGHKLSRAGLDAMIREVAADYHVSHILIPRRDRLARPEDPVDALQIENQLRRQGITLIYMDRVLSPLARGKRADVGEMIVGVVEYDAAGKFRRELADKMIRSQISLAKMGFSTGGRPPFGFRRWLIREGGDPVRELPEGEIVRMAGHHVVWLPGPDEEIAIVLRILVMLESMPASRVATVLTSEGIPSPDAGRVRSERKIPHQVAGRWHQTTILGIARNPLLRAITRYGLRSMGEQLRFSPTGPRELEDVDFLDGNKRKVIRNSESVQITSKAGFDPLVDPERHTKLIAELDRRAGSQRGKPRSRKPAQNPLGCRIIDMSCNWPMYRQPHKDSFRYTCGLYQQTSGKECAHNHVDGPLSTQFALSCLRQRLLSPTMLPKLQKKLAELAHQQSGNSGPMEAISAMERELTSVDADLKKVTGNLARAGSDAEYAAISKVFQELQDRRKTIQAGIEKERSRVTAPRDAAAEVQQALGLVERLSELASDPENLAAAAEAFQITQTRLFFAFKPVKLKKRVVQRIASGIVTFGETESPVPIYEGPTARDKQKTPAACADGVSGPDDAPRRPKRRSGRKAKSLGNVSRDDRI